MSHPSTLSRRRFIKSSALLAFPAIVPASVLGASAPSNRITIGCIGVGRMGMGDLKDFINRNNTQIVAVSDLDTWRVNNARTTVEQHYAKARPEAAKKACSMYHDYRELLARDDIDAVSIATPDHWHAQPAIDAARAGKDIFLEKPLTYTLREGRALVDAVDRYGRVFITGSMQRSYSGFKRAVELVLNGHIGEVLRIKVGLNGDPGCGPEPVQPVPEGLDYNRWLGPAPWAPYTEKRVHSPNGLKGRPGWLRVSDYCLGMITGWGAHHVDIAQWGAGIDRGGPISIEGWGNYHERGLWNVHGDFKVELGYRKGPPISVASARLHPHGVTFEGTKGTVFVNRSRLTANPASILDGIVGPGDRRVNPSRDHKGNFLECIATRRETCAPVEVGHRSCSACILTNIGMKLRRPLTWDPDKEEFPGDDEANRMLYRPDRPWESLEGKAVLA